MNSKIKEVEKSRLGSVYAQLNFQLNSDKIRLREKQLDFLSYFIVYGAEGRNKAMEHCLTINHRVWYNQMKVLLNKKMLYKKYDKLYLNPDIIIQEGDVELILRIKEVPLEDKEEKTDFKRQQEAILLEEKRLRELEEDEYEYEFEEEIGGDSEDSNNSEAGGGL